MSLPRVAKGHIEQVPTRSFRVSVSAGIDPLTRRAIRLKSTVKTEQQARIEFGKLLKDASEGRTPESDATVAKLMDECAAPSSTSCARLKRCGDLICTGKPFIEHRNIPVLAVNLGGLVRPRLPPRRVPGARLSPAGMRRGELCGLQIRDVDFGPGLVHIAFNYVVRGGQHVLKDTKTQQDRWLAIDPATCTLGVTYLDEIRAELVAVGVGLRDDAYLFSNDPAHTRPWNPDWATHKVADAAAAAGVALDIKGGRHYTASQLLAGGFDLQNTVARLGHSGGGATTLRHYADQVPEVDRRAAAHLAQLTAGPAAQSGQ